MVLPLRFMLTGLLAFLTAMVMLLLRPEILAAYHYNQYVISMTHLLVLGWILSIVMGAMYQLVPVALETELYSERLARWQYLLHLAGFVGMTVMFWTWNMKQVGHFGSVLTAGVGLFVFNLVRTLLRIRRWNVIAFSVASALGWLSLAVLAGLTLAAGKCSYDALAARAPSGPLGGLVVCLRSLGTLPAHFDQMSAMHAHAHLGAIGVFLMLIVGISYKLLPMFTLSELQSRWRPYASIALLNSGLLGAFFAILLRSPAKFAFAILIVTGLVIYGWEVVAIVRARKRRLLDWGLKYFLTALCLLGVVAALALLLSWPGLPLTPFTGQLENLYGFLGLAGVFSLAIVGMLFKILPFLVWYRSYSRSIGKVKVPSLADLYSPAWQKTGYWTYLAGLAITGAGILPGNAVLIRCGCGVLLASLLALAFNAVKILSHLVQPRIEPLAASPAAGPAMPVLIGKTATQ